MITLYGAPVSGNTYKARLLLSLFGLEFEEINVNLMTGENRTESFLALNPRGQIPVLVDAGVTGVGLAGDPRLPRTALRRWGVAADRARRHGRW